jgi:hypothetical protein
MFTKIADLSEEFDDWYSHEFNPPAAEEEISAWEEENSAKIPESYKEWLRLTNGCEIRNGFETFYGIHDIKKQSFLPDDLFEIGSVVGDGELVCFSEATGKILRFDHGHLTEFGSFADILEWVIQTLEEDDRD